MAGQAGWYRANLSLHSLEGDANNESRLSVRVSASSSTVRWVFSRMKWKHYCMLAGDFLVGYVKHAL